MNNEPYAAPNTTKCNLSQGGTVAKKQQTNMETDDPITVTLARIQATQMYLAPKVLLGLPRKTNEVESEEQGL